MINAFKLSILFLLVLIIGLHLWSAEIFVQSWHDLSILHDTARTFLNGEGLYPKIHPEFNDGREMLLYGPIYFVLQGGVIALFGKSHLIGVILSLISGFAFAFAVYRYAKVYWTPLAYLIFLVLLLKTTLKIKLTEFLILFSLIPLAIFQIQVSLFPFEAIALSCLILTRVSFVVEKSSVRVANYFVISLLLSLFFKFQFNNELSDIFLFFPVGVFLLFTRVTVQNLLQTLFLLSLVNQSYMSGLISLGGFFLFDLVKVYNIDKYKNTYTLGIVLLASSFVVVSTSALHLLIVSASLLLLIGFRTEENVWL